MTSLIENYRAQAENIVVHHFLQLAGEAKDAFFTALRQVCGETSTIYKLFQGSEYTFSRQQKYYLLMLMPSFLPTEDRYRLLQLELLNTLQRYKKTYQQQHFVSEQELWNIYEKYVSKVYILGTHPLQWFLPESYTVQEIQETAQGIIYGALKEADLHIKGFQEDSKIIKDKAKKELHSFVYVEHTFGLSVKLGISDSYNAKFNIDFEALERTSHSIFTSFLPAYINEQDIYYEKLAQDRTIQQLVLAKDLENSLQHYQKSKGFMRKVDISLHLEGKGGVISLETENFKLKNKETNNWVSFGNSMIALIVLPLILFASLPLIILLINTLGLLIFLVCLGILGRFTFKGLTKKTSVHTYSIENLKGLVKDFRQEFDELLQDKKHTHNLVANQFDEMFKRLWKTVLGEVRQGVLQETNLYHPDHFQKVYRRAMKHLKRIRTAHIGGEFFVQVPHLSPHTCLDILKYALRCQLRKSYLQFSSITETLMEHGLEAEFYITMLEMRGTLHQFYKRDLNRFAWGEPVVDWYRKSAKKIRNFDDYISFKPFTEGLPTDLREWFEKKMLSIEEDSFEKDFKLLRHQIYVAHQNKIATNSNETPIFYENAEVVLYAF